MLSQEVWDKQCVEKNNQITYHFPFEEKNPVYLSFSTNWVL